jgi:hypothetical protein
MRQKRVDAACGPGVPAERSSSVGWKGPATLHKKTNRPEQLKNCVKTLQEPKTGALALFKNRPCTPISLTLSAACRQRFRGKHAPPPRSGYGCETVRNPARGLMYRRGPVLRRTRIERQDVPQACKPALLGPDLQGAPIWIGTYDGGLGVRRTAGLLATG